MSEPEIHDDADGHAENCHHQRLAQDFPVQHALLESLLKRGDDDEVYLDTESIFGGRAVTVRQLLGQMVVDFPPTAVLRRECKADLFRLFNLAVAFGAALERTRALTWADEAPLTLDLPPARSVAEDRVLGLARLWGEQFALVERTAIGRGSHDVEQMSRLAQVVDLFRAAINSLPPAALPAGQQP